MNRGTKISKTGVIIVNTGSPAEPTSEAVADYLRRFLSDPRICPINPHVWKFTLEHFIIPKRAPRSAEKYSRIWTDEGSPLDVHMKSLVRKLNSELKDEGFGCVGYATSYSSPSIKDALEECLDDGCGEVIVLPLYPQSAFSTTKAVYGKLDEALASCDQPPQIRFIENYYDDPAYIEALAKTIDETDFDASSGDKLLFVFHSIPFSDIDSGDTYPDQARFTAHHVAETLDIDENSWAIGYQCRFDKSRKWLGPFTMKTLDDLPDARRLFVIAPNFSVDCLETLHDIQIDLKRAWLEKHPEKGEDSFCYIPCLNDSDAHAAALAQVISKGGQST